MKNQIIKALVNNGKMRVFQLQSVILKNDSLSNFDISLSTLAMNKDVIMSQDDNGIIYVELSGTCQPSDFI